MFFLYIYFFLSLLKFLKFKHQICYTSTNSDKINDNPKTVSGQHICMRNLIELSRVFRGMTGLWLQFLFLLLCRVNLNFLSSIVQLKITWPYKPCSSHAVVVL